MKNDRFWSNKKILIVGASGFVGSSLFSSFQEKKCNVYKFSREKNDEHLNYEKLSHAMTGMDIVINCAALDGNSAFKKENSALILSENTAIASNVLNIAQKNRVNKVILFSSADIYSSELEAPFAEEDDFNRYPDLNRDGYVLSKIFTEILAKKYIDDFKMNILVLRPTNIFGLHDKKNGIIPTIYQKIMRGEQLVILGNGQQKRNFIYVNDLSKIVGLLIEKDAQGTINIGSSETVDINKLIEIISKLLNKKCEVKYIDTDDAKNRNLNIGKLMSLINYKFDPIEKAMAEMYL